MSREMAAVTTYSIGLAIMVFGLFYHKRKYDKDLQYKVGGLSLKSFKMLSYASIAFFLYLIISILAGWKKY
ncbi:MAG: hypothetical protein V4722_22525 [Bacteroidota bacterium]